MRQRRFFARNQAPAEQIPNRGFFYLRPLFKGLKFLRHQGFDAPKRLSAEPRFRHHKPQIFAFIDNYQRDSVYDHERLNSRDLKAVSLRSNWLDQHPDIGLEYKLSGRTRQEDFVSPTP